MEKIKKQELQILRIKDLQRLLLCGKSTAVKIRKEVLSLYNKKYLTRSLLERYLSE